MGDNKNEFYLKNRRNRIKRSIDPRSCLRDLEKCVFIVFTETFISSAISLYFMFSNTIASNTRFILGGRASISFRSCSFLPPTDPDPQLRQGIQ